jgi:KDO2-lipid IV(A) lauroyltransferase
MTAPALARLAFKFDCTVLPAQVERLRGARFRLTVHPPLPLERSDDIQRDTLLLMTRANAMLESWIRQRPGQWLWLHRRWPD